jgi:predicted alpha/beta superfamily hydrolase
MRLRAVVAFSILFVLGSASILLAQTPKIRASAASPSPYLADVSTWLVTSARPKRKYQISVALPSGYATTHEPYPILFAADANAEFGTVVETARLLRVSKAIPDLVIVGIGYANPGQGFKASFALRSLDLTPTANPAMLALVQDFAKRYGLPVPEAIGGAPDFLDFIRTELVPSIQRKYNVSHDDRAWFGHSWGGLFGVYAMLNNNGLFRRFLIGSPDLSWDDKVIFKSEEVYFASHKALPVRVFFAIGAEEEKADDPSVSDLRAFTAQLRARNYQGLDFDTQIFDGETHLSVIPTTISRGLRYIYSGPEPDAVRKR